MTGTELPLLVVNPMRFAKVGVENAHLQKDNPKAYAKLKRKVTNAVKGAKADWRKMVRESHKANLTNKQVSKLSAFYPLAD